MALASPRSRVQHLLRRTTFGVSARELEEYVALGVEGTVERLLNPETIDDSAADAAVAAIAEPFALAPDSDEVKTRQRQALARTWYTRLLWSRRPFLERMTYFWHDHFATGLGKVGNPLFMHRQNETLRAHALGRFEALALAVTRDPAMMIYLDNRSNGKTAPNENYAREFLELHTLGEGGGYGERDIKEAARALTGWRLVDGVPTFQVKQHDLGVKTILGQSGNFNDEGLVAMLARHPRTATYIADKLVRFFVRPSGSEALTARAASTFTSSGGDIRAVMRTILLAPEMFEEASYRAMVKAPVEIVVGASRALEVPTDGQPEHDGARRMGQALFDPPNPAGWPGGPAWINATTVLARSNYSSELTRLKAKHIADVPALLRSHGMTSSAGAVVDWVLDLLVGGDVPSTTREVLVNHIGGTHFDFERAAREGTLNGMVYLALTMPLYQVA